MPFRSVVERAGVSRTPQDDTGKVQILLGHVAVPTSSVLALHCYLFFFFSSRRRHTRFKCDWSSDVCSSDLTDGQLVGFHALPKRAVLEADELAIGGELLQWLALPHGVVAGDVVENLRLEDE